MYETPLRRAIALAKTGTRTAIDEITATLTPDISIAESKFIDFALSHVESEEGIRVMEDYLFHCTQIQRNYAALYFGRRGEYPLLRRAYEAGAIDGIQAFSR